MARLSPKRSAEGLLRTMPDAAIVAAGPATLSAGQFASQAKGRGILVEPGKSAAAIAHTAEAAWADVGHTVVVVTLRAFGANRMDRS